MVLNAEVEKLDEAKVLVVLSGRLTLGMRLREVESQITESLGEGTQRLILDLSAVEYADSAGLGMLMLLYGKMKTLGGQLRLASPSEQLLRLFKLTSTDSILEILPDRAAALAG